MEDSLSIPFNQPAVVHVVIGLRLTYHSILDLLIDITLAVEREVKH